MTDGIALLYTMFVARKYMEQMQPRGAPPNVRMLPVGRGKNSERIGIVAFVQQASSLGLSVCLKHHIRSAQRGRQYGI